MIEKVDYEICSQENLLDKTGNVYQFRKLCYLVCFKLDENFLTWNTGWVCVNCLFYIPLNQY